MRVFFVAFGVGAVATMIGLAIDYGPHNPWSYVLFGIVATCVLVGGVSVIWGMIAVLKRGRDAGL
jgi:hypothetical protein